MSKDEDRLEHQHVQKQARESRIFVMCAGALMVAAITFGLLNTFHFIHV